MSALQSTFGSFAIRDFRYFWTVLLISLLALTLAYVLMPFALHVAAGGDSWWSLSGFYVAQGSAVIVFGLFAAVAADRFAKKPLMLIGLIGAAIMLLLLGALIVAGLSTWDVIVGIGVCLGVAISVLQIVQVVWVGELVPKRLIANGAALQRAPWLALSSVGSVIVMAMLIDLDIDLGWAFVILAALLLVAVWVAWQLPWTAPAVRYEDRRPILREFGAAFRYVARTRRLRALCLFGIVFGSGSAVATLAFTFAQAEFDRLVIDSALITAVVAIVSILLVIGVARVVAPRRVALIILVFGTVTAIAAWLAAASWSLEIVTAACYLASLAIGGAALMVSIAVLIHSRPEFFARSMMVVLLGWGIGSVVLAGWMVLASEIGERETLAIVGAVAVAATLGMFVAWRRIDTLPPEPGSAAEAVALAAAPLIPFLIPPGGEQFAPVAVFSEQKSGNEDQQDQR